MKSKEELLSEEVRAAENVASRMMQWGVTVMISLQTALFFLRQDILKRYIDAKVLLASADVPDGRYYMGTAFLIFVATILAVLTARSLAQYRNYKTQLIACRSSGVKDLPIRFFGTVAYVLYFFFPAADALSHFLIKHYG
jgi:hypothetical protein